MADSRCAPADVGGVASGTSAGAADVVCGSRAKRACCRRQNFVIHRFDADSKPRCCRYARQRSHRRVGGGGRLLAAVRADQKTGNEPTSEAAFSLDM